MQTVALLGSFLRAADQAGMSQHEIETLVDFLAANPSVGDEIRGTGGCRKVRWAGRGKGKSGGFRTVTFYSGNRMPLFLITVFSKGERADLTSEERNRLAMIAKSIVQEYRSKSRTTKGI